MITPLISSTNRIATAVAGCFGLLEVRNTTIALPSRAMLLFNVDRSRDANLKRDSEAPMVSVHLASSLIQQLADQSVSYTRDLESY